VTGLTGGATEWLSPVAVSVLAAALLLAVVNVSRSRTAVVEETRAWRLIFLGVAIVAAAALLAQGIGLLPSTHQDEIGRFVFSVGCVIASAPLYQALVHWSRSRTRTSDPSESVNGFSAFLVLTALGNVLLPQAHPPLQGLGGWQFQASLLACSALVVLLGTAFWVAAFGGLLRDRRLWLIVAGLTSMATAQTVEMTAGSGGWAFNQPVWLLSGALIVSAALVVPGTDFRSTVANQATIVGALVVQSLGVVVLSVDNRLPPSQGRLATCYALAGVLGASVRVLQLVRDLAHLAQTRHEAMTDELTGIPNRRALLMAVDAAFLNARSASLLIVDLDRFKEVNDRYGHAAGDRLLRHTAEAFAAQVPAGAFLSRLGGDEFAVLLTDAETDGAQQLGRDLALAATAPLSDVRGRILQVGASIGIATVALPGVDGGELLRRADAAMYQAKTCGSGVRVYDSALDAAAQERLELIEELRIALREPVPLEQPREHQIVVYFQPQLNVAGGQVVGAEALVRWRHPRLGLLTPDLFIDLAEQNALMPLLTARVLREASAQTRLWRASGHALRVSVNLSAGCLATCALLPLIDEVLAAGTPAHDLVLEVTESSLMKDPVQALEAMNRIAARGVGISIDDYGTGYCSLSYMNDLPAGELKIDRSFTARMTRDPRTAAIVAGTVELAHRLGMRLIAEGVEDAETLAMVTDLGCDESQGYLHSRPMPAEVFLDWLNAGRPGPATYRVPPVSVVS
jgi:diguanylate cyclase (GGDEF)-like protein